MAHSWIWRRSELDFGHWFIWELLQDGIDRGELVVDVGVVWRSRTCVRWSVVRSCQQSLQSWLVSPSSSEPGTFRAIVLASPNQNGPCVQQK